MKQVMRYILSAALLIVIGCERETIPTSSDEKQPRQWSQEEGLAKGADDQSMEAHEQRLKHFARALAKALEVPEVASYLKEEIGKKFDGDYDALWKGVKDRAIGQGSLRSVIASNLQGLNGAIRSIDNVEQVPRLQIALPVRFEDWDGVAPIKVAYTPLTIDDTEWEVVYAYDAAGNEYELDPQTPPDSPVMVVGINERTDDKDPPFNAKLPLPCEIDCGGGGGGATPPPSPRENGDFEKLEKAQILYDHEPWVKGSPEIYFLIKSLNKSFSMRLNKYSEWDAWFWGDDTDWHTLNDVLFEWQAAYEDIFVMYIWEYDGGSTITVSLNVLGVTLQYQVNDGDDVLGHTTWSKQDSYRTTSTAYSTGDAKFILKWW